MIFCGTQALDVEERNGGVVVKTATGRITADAAVVATNTPFNDRVAIHVKQYAYQSYVVAALIRRGSMPRMLIWDDTQPYHYVRTTHAADDEHDVLIVGGADHKTGQEAHPEQHYRELETWLRDRFAEAGPLVYRWSGEVLEPLDGLAYLGRNPGSRNVYVITGDSGNGISHATIGAMLVSDLVVGRQNPWLALYDPSRKRIPGGDVVPAPAVEHRCAVLGLDFRRRYERRGGALARRRRADPLRAAQARGVPGRARRTACALGDVPASRLHRALERGREDLGLPVPWLSLQRVR